MMIMLMVLISCFSKHHDHSHYSNPVHPFTHIHTWGQRWAYTVHLIKWNPDPFTNICKVMNTSEAVCSSVPCPAILGHVGCRGIRPQPSKLWMTQSWVSMWMCVCVCVEEKRGEERNSSGLWKKKPVLTILLAANAPELSPARQNKIEVLKTNRGLLRTCLKLLSDAFSFTARGFPHLSETDCCFAQLSIGWKHQYLAPLQWGFHDFLWFVLM